MASIKSITGVLGPYYLEKPAGEGRVAPAAHVQKIDDTTREAEPHAPETMLKLLKAAENLSKATL